MSIDEDEDALDDEWKAQAQAPPPRPPDAWYPYRDEQEVISYWKHRTHKLNDAGEWVKEIRYYHPDKRTPGLPDGVQKLPYRLPEMIEAVELGQTIWLCEGEKDANGLVDAGVCATTCGGVGDWKQVEETYARVLKGAPVVICPDRDAPGIGLAQKMLQTLQPVAASVTIRLPHHAFKDAAEHLEHLSLEDIRPALTVYPDSPEVLDLRDSLRLRLDDGSLDEEPEVRNPCLDIEAVLASETVEEWLVVDVWPSGRQVHLHAQRKTGKSLLSLWIACNLSFGRDPFTWVPREPIRVLYLDLEMTEADFRDRLGDMSFTPEQMKLIVENLRYLLLPVLLPLDTQEGGLALVQLVQRENAQAVMLDTLARVCQGKENDADTYKNFAAHTGLLLKRMKIPLWRTDQEGHDPGRSRGSSAKADDVDVVWGMTATEKNATDKGYKLERKFTRVNYVREFVHILRVDEPLGFMGDIANSWPDGTKEKARELDELEAPFNISKNKAIALLKANKRKVGTTTVLLAALRHRKEPLYKFQA